MSMDWENGPTLPPTGNEAYGPISQITDIDTIFVASHSPGAFFFLIPLLNTSRIDEKPIRAPKPLNNPLQ